MVYTQPNYSRDSLYQPGFGQVGYERSTNCVGGIGVTAVCYRLFQQPARVLCARYTPEKCGLSIELPGEPKLMNVPIPDDLQVHYMNLYLYDGSEIVVLFSHTSATVVLSPKTLAEGVVKGMIKNPGVSDFSYSTEPGTESSAPIKGTYKQSGIVFEINGIALSQEKHGWLVVSVYKQTSVIAQAAARRILSSIKTEGRPCAERKEVVGQNSRLGRTELGVRSVF